VPGTTYRFYVNMLDPTDRMSAVFGNNESNLVINTPDGAFPNTVNASWNASGINPVFLPLFPEMADDTYATIGLDGPASASGIAGVADPSIVEDTSEQISPYFMTDGATGLLSSTNIGAAWYVLHTAENGLPNSDMRGLVLQVTTTGSISGTINYQAAPIFVEDNNPVAPSVIKYGEICSEVSSTMEGSATPAIPEADAGPSRPIVAYVSSAISGNNGKNTGLIPEAFQLAFTVFGNAPSGVLITRFDSLFPNTALIRSVGSSMLT
jgi:hypothetical protein